MCDSFWSGSTLALLPSPQHNALVASLLGPHSVGAGNGKSPLVGIRNYASSENYFANVDKTRLYYSNWVAGKPNHLEQGIENCVEMKWSPEWSFNGGAEVGQWENRDCGEKRPYLCSHAEDPAIKEYDYNGSKQTWANQTCYDGWIPKSAGCYKFFTEKKSYDDASKFCQNAVDDQVSGAIKGDLVTFWDDYERNHAFSFFRDDSVERRNEVDLPFFGDFGIWVGLDKKRNETWRWIDEWPMTGTHWAPGSCFLKFKRLKLIKDILNQMMETALISAKKDSSSIKLAQLRCPLFAKQNSSISLQIGRILLIILAMLSTVMKTGANSTSTASEASRNRSRGIQPGKIAKLTAETWFRFIQNVRLI
jgi:hypothetical protein